MALQEVARSRAIWAGKVAAVFVFAGGAIGGAAVGLVSVVGSIAGAPEHYLPLELFSQLPASIAMMSLFGIAFGFPAAALTAAAYVIGVKTMRHRWRLTAFGVGASALWGALFITMISYSPAPPENYFGMSLFFAIAGGAATLGCFSLLKRWRLQAPA